MLGIFSIFLGCQILPEVSIRLFFLFLFLFYIKSFLQISLLIVLELTFNLWNIDNVWDILTSFRHLSH